MSANRMRRAVKVSPDRGRMKRKWRMDRESGPCVLLAERVLKKLVQHSWPCATEPEAGGASVLFVPLRGRPPFGPDYFGALRLAVRIVSDEERVPLVLDGLRLSLPGLWFVDPYGKVKPGDPVDYVLRRDAAALRAKRLKHAQADLTGPAQGAGERSDPALRGG